LLLRFQRLGGVLDIIGGDRRRIGVGLHARDVVGDVLVPCAANCVLRVISWVAAPCSCTAAAIAGCDLVDLADDAADALDGVDGVAATL